MWMTFNYYQIGDLNFLLKAFGFKFYLPVLFFQIIIVTPLILTWVECLCDEAEICYCILLL